MTDVHSDPWHQLAEDIENGCAEFNRDRIDARQRPFPFPVDVVRRLLLVLKDARRPLPAFDIVTDGPEWRLMLRWTRIGGEAYVTASRDDVIDVRVALDGRVLVDTQEARYASFDPQPLLDALDHFTALKQVLVVRRDLKMRQGKACSQASHASGEFMREQIVAAIHRHDDLNFSDDEIEWMTLGMAKITVRADTVEQFEQVQADALARGLKVRTITDSGRTEFAGVPTITALAIGPTRSAYVDPITGAMTLL